MQDTLNSGICKIKLQEEHVLHVWHVFISVTYNYGM
jgi:hypothetical protein